MLGTLAVFVTLFQESYLVFITSVWDLTADMILLATTFAGIVTMVTKSFACLEVTGMHNLKAKTITSQSCSERLHKNANNYLFHLTLPKCLEV